MPHTAAATAHLQLVGGVCGIQKECLAGPQSYSLLQLPRSDKGDHHRLIRAHVLEVQNGGLGALAALDFHQFPNACALSHEGSSEIQLLKQMSRTSVSAGSNVELQEIIAISMCHRTARSRTPT